VDGLAATSAGLGLPLTPETVLALQRTIGNAAVARLVEQHRRAQNEAHSDMHERADPAAAGPSAEVQRLAVHQVLRSQGRRLDDPVRTEMEARLGADFTGVRIHDDAVAQRSATELGARAYTSGNHVVIGQGGADKHTLAHELTHVIQQRQGPVAGTDHGDGTRVSHPDDRFERAAEANARAVLSASLPQPTDVHHDGPPTKPEGEVNSVQRGHEVTPSTVQRLISVGGASVDWHAAKNLLASEKGIDKFRNEGKLDFVLRILDSIQCKCDTTADLVGAMERVHQDLNTFGVDAVNSKDWAVFHRLRGGSAGRGFDDFLKARGLSGEAFENQKKEYINTDAKYEPFKFGGSHTWDRNEKWLEAVRGRKIVLTDVPLRKANIMRKLTDTGEPLEKDSKGANPHANEVSAYGREIAYALARDYVPLWLDHVRAGDDESNVRRLPVHVMVPPHEASLAKFGESRYVDVGFMRGIAERGTIEDPQRLLEEFEWAGLPTDLGIDPGERRHRVKAKHDERDAKIKRQEDAEAVRKQKEEKVEAIDAKREQEASEKKRVLKEGGFPQWLAKELASAGCTSKGYWPKGSIADGILERAKSSGYVEAVYSKKSLKTYIEAHVRNLLPG